MSFGIKTQQRRRIAAAGVAMSSLLAMLTACGGSDGSNEAGGACDVPGVTDTSVALGAIADISGVYSFQGPFADGAKARIEAANAAGGVNGRKLTLEVADDASDVANNLATARSLVEGKDVVGVLMASSFTAGSGDYLKGVGLPVVGYGITLEFQDHAKYPNFIAYGNNVSGATNATSISKVWGEFLKSKGATTVYSVGSGTPQGARSATALIVSSEAAGLKKGVLTTDLPTGTTNFTGEAQKAKQAGVDALALPLGGPASVAVLKAMKQADVPIKVSILLSGYDPAILKEAGDALEGASFWVPFAPFETNAQGITTYKDALAKYAPKATVGQYTMVGWLSANLLIAGIEKAGSCPSRKNVLKAITELKDYDADGMIPATDFSDPQQQAAAPTCLYVVTVKGGAFVPDNEGKPFCVSDTKPLPIR
ncbi:ABC transporter substrate-binding protein [Dactylosporangium sucinum]|uniref:Branched-chain amino acid ABC transporter substrate-binding protein n=1 Tax=Dactylosporangium sucinum TaxID=1424081 RepID=A0A917U861_9ACTN|nr:ABC transporter substrate-binding protein [Dactylosporangium sucinum]GGM64614.1 branched-chain amino acid ABC transporter substrate-binding protein [Dactylosporangium sucinum]